MDDLSESKNVIQTLPGANDGMTTGEVQSNIINWLFYVAGVLAVIMIIFCGIKMTVSSGDSGAVAKAKQGLIYSLVGLAVVILAYAIVNFVIGKF